MHFQLRKLFSDVEWQVIYQSQSERRPVVPPDPLHWHSVKKNNHNLFQPYQILKMQIAINSRVQIDFEIYSFLKFVPTRCRNFQGCLNCHQTCKEISLMYLYGSLFLSCLLLESSMKISLYSSPKCCIV